MGEISSAMEQAFGRHQASIKVVSGVYRDEAKLDREFEEIAEKIALFESKNNRPPRILVAKVGQDGHDRGQKIIASAFADLGFEVGVGAMFQTPDEVAQRCIEQDVDIVGVSTLAAGHLTLIPELKAALRARGRADIAIVVGGVIPDADFEALFEAGVMAIFPPGTVVTQAANEVLDKINAAMGHNIAGAEI